MEHNTSFVPKSPRFLGQFSLEENFPIQKAEKWMQENYHHCYYYTAVYLIAIFGIQECMKKRTPFKLKRLLIGWNVCLAVISALAASRFIQELYYVLNHFGFKYSICNPSYLTETNVTAFWSYVCVATKVLELADTLFVVFRKQKLLFLHWFHHASVLLFTWIGIRDVTAAARWSMSINFSVHAIMYAYYALRAMGVKIPRNVAMCITTAQILQMVVGFYICLQGSVWYFSGNFCSTSTRTAIFGISIYTVYLVLFLQFFVASYFKPKSHVKAA